jgi:DNA-binding NarL/FixJ family response regulator
LHVSLATAKTHVSRLLMKLDARDRARLVLVA